jgi:hypothetical protein
VLHDLDVVVTDATPFSRYLAGTWPPDSPIPTRPLKVLVAIANPENLDEYNLMWIDAEAEWTALRKATANLDGT